MEKTFFNNNNWTFIVSWNIWTFTWYTDKIKEGNRVHLESIRGACSFKSFFRQPVMESDRGGCQVDGIPYRGMIQWSYQKGGDIHVQPWEAV
jgi:hypothetical protein